MIEDKETDFDAPDTLTLPKPRDVPSSDELVVAGEMLMLRNEMDPLKFGNLLMSCSELLIDMDELRAFGRFLLLVETEVKLIDEPNVFGKLGRSGEFVRECSPSEAEFSALERYELPADLLELSDAAAEIERELGNELFSVFSLIDTDPPNCRDKLMFPPEIEIELLPKVRCKSDEEESPLILTDDGMEDFGDAGDSLELAEEEGSPLMLTDDKKDALADAGSPLTLTEEGRADPSALVDAVLPKLIEEYLESNLLVSMSAEASFSLAFCCSLIFLMSSCCRLDCSSLSSSLSSASSVAAAFCDCCLCFSHSWAKLALIVVAPLVAGLWGR